MYKVIIAHPGQQTSFRRAEALKKCGILNKYITTIYLMKKYKSIIYSFLSKISKNESLRLLGRSCDALEDNDILSFCRLYGFFLIILNRFDKKQKIYQKLNYWISSIFSIKVAKYSIKQSIDLLIMMGAAPAKAFEYLNNKKSNIVKIFDMTSIAYNYQTVIMSREKEKLPKEWSHFILRNNENKLDEQLMKNIYLADHIIVSSKFAQESLLYNNIPLSKIHIIQYGIDSDISSDHVAKFSNGEKLNLLFVGQVSCEKGIYYLLEAIKKIPQDKVKLTVVGSNHIFPSLLNLFSKYVNFVGDIPASMVKEYYCSSHILIVPTLFDSFGRVITEAMSYGLPVISTSSAGASDYIQNGINGFVIRPSNVDDIVKKINYFLENPKEVYKMGLQSKQVAKNNTWEKYYSQYSTLIKNLIYTTSSQKN